MIQNTENQSQTLMAQKMNLKKIASSIGLTLVVYFLIQSIVSFLFSFTLRCILFTGTTFRNKFFYSLLSSLTSEAGVWFINLFIGVVAGAVAIFLLSKLLGFRLQDFYQKPHQGSAYAAKGTVLFLDANLITSALTSIILTILTDILGHSPASPDFSVSYQQPSAVFFYLLYAVILAPIIEETLFRGLILRSLQNFGNLFAIAVSSLLFGLWHGNFEQAIPIILSSAIFGIIAIRSNSLIPSIIAHSLNNLIIFSFNLLFDLATPDFANRIYFLVILILLLIGVFILYRSFSSLKVSDLNRSQLSTGQRFGSFFAAPGMVGAILILVLEFGLTLLP